MAGMHEGCGGEFVPSYYGGLRCTKCGSRRGAAGRRKPRRAGRPRSSGRSRRPVAIAVALAVMSLGAAWYLGLVPAEVEDAILNMIDRTGEAIPADVENAIQDAIDRTGEAIPADVEDSVLNAIDSIEEEVLGGTADVPETVPDVPAANPAAEAPASPLDRTIYPDGTTHGSKHAAQEDVAPIPSGPADGAGPVSLPPKNERTEDLIYVMTNQYREAAGLPPLDRVSKIDQIARSHSQDMAERNYFEHETPEGLDPTDRGNAAGYGCRKDYGSYYTFGLGENIFWHSGGWYGAERLAEEIMEGWMDSPGHRQNIMDPNYDRIGVGVAISGSVVYATQNFC